MKVLAIGAVRYGKFVKGVSKKVQDALAEATAEAEQNISNLRTVLCLSPSLSPSLSLSLFLFLSPLSLSLSHALTLAGGAGSLV